MSAEDETRVDVPAAVADRALGDTLQSGSGPHPGRSASKSLSADLGTETSPREAMRREEIARLRALNRVLRWMSIALLSTIPFFGGSSLLRTILIVGLVAGIPLGYWFDRIVDRPGGLTPERMTATAIAVGVNIYIGILFFGTFSGATTVVVLGLFIASRSEFLNSAYVLYVLYASAQAVFGTLIIAGVIEDPGLIQIAERPLFEQIVMLILIEGMYLGGYLIGLASRRITLEAFEEVEGARRQVGQRDALLHEARQDLDRALQIGGPGRYTEQTIGSFEIGVVIGRGAMAEVYEAKHTETGEPAAVKLLHRNLLAEPRTVARFLREARAASSLDTPHIARVLEASDPLAPLPYLALELLRGNDLAHHLRRKPIMSPARVVELVQQVATVVDQAAAAGLVHRDLKPQNLFLAEQGNGRAIWKVLDFGVALLAEGSGTLTQGRVVGTPSYMSPEQARGGDVDRRTDIHALAAITYRCLTGRPPFVGRDVPSMLYAAVHHMPDRPSGLADLPPEIDAVLAIGLAKRREDRFERARDFADTLARAARGELDPALRGRAVRLLDELPWGTRG